MPDIPELRWRTILGPSSERQGIALVVLLGCQHFLDTLRFGVWGLLGRAPTCWGLYLNLVLPCRAEVKAPGKESVIL